MRRSIPVVLVLVLAAFGAACGSDAKTPAAGSSSSSSSSNAVVTTSIPGIATSAPTSTTQGPAATTSTSAPGPTTSLPAPATAEEAARGLVDRWGASDRTGALQFATQEVIDSLFVNDGTGNTWMFQGCEGVAGGAVCSFSFEGGATQVHAQNLGTIGETGLRIDDIQFVAD